MKGEFLSDEEVRRSYHSGLSGHLIRADRVLSKLERVATDKLIRFTTSKYPAPQFRVTLRSDKNGWQDHEGTFDEEFSQWKFTLPAHTYADTFWMKLVLHEESGPEDRCFFWMSGGDVEVPAEESVRDLNDYQAQFAYHVQFKTSLWHPNHLVTLRNDIDGWGRDLYGVFRHDTWHFSLDRSLYSSSASIKFVLDRSRFMEGDNLTVSNEKQWHECDDSQVSFSATPSAYKHGYDNFISTETRNEQLSVRSIGRPEEAYDVIVIGSGMGGGVVADALSDQGVKVLVLEAGGLRFPVHMNELPRSEINYVGRDQIGHFNNEGCAEYFGHSGVHFNLGGRSVYWSGLIPRMQSWEFREPWPASVRDYLLVGTDGTSGYDRAEKLMRKQKTLGPYQNDVVDHLETQLDDTFEILDLPRSLHQPDLNSEEELQNVIQRSTGGFSTADLLLDSLGFADQAGTNHLRVNLHHLVKHIETDGDRATEVVCQDLVGETERRYRASYIVLACGSLESAKLALCSGLSDNSNYKIGKGLTDHPAYFYKRLHDLPDEGPLAWLGNPRGHAKLMLRHKQATADEHAYNIELLINAKYWDTRHADDDLWNRRIDNGKQAQVEIKFIFDSILDEGNRIVANGVHQKPDVYVALNESAAGYKEEIVEVRNRVLESLGVTGLSTEYDQEEWSEGIHGSVHHAGGTLRMSHDGSGVVDENLKFEAYDNLYCCDVSVYPTIPAANPSLTLTALALRLADTLKDRIDSEL